MKRQAHFITFIFLIGTLLLACKPTRKSYLPYKKRNKCGCPTYGLKENIEFKNQQSAYQTLKSQVAI